MYPDIRFQAESTGAQKRMRDPSSLPQATFNHEVMV